MSAVSVKSSESPNWQVNNKRNNTSKPSTQLLAYFYIINVAICFDSKGHLQASVINYAKGNYTIVIMFRTEVSNL